MRIAVSAATDQGLDSPVSPHFGRCPYYVFVDLDEANGISNVTPVPNRQAAGHAPGELPAYIKQQGVHVMISGGMGVRAVDFFRRYDIRVATGAGGTVRQALENYLGGNLQGDVPCAESEEHRMNRAH